MDQAVDNVEALGQGELGAEVEDDALLAVACQLQELLVERDASVRKLSRVELEVIGQSERLKHDLWQEVKPSER